MKKIYQVYCKIEEVLVGTAFVSIVVLIFSAAFFRQFDRPIVWADDIAKFLFSWTAFLGADVAMRYSRLVGVDILVRKLPRKIAFVYYGTLLSIESVDRSFQTLSNVSYSIVTASLPVSSLLMILTASLKIVKIVHNFRDNDYEVTKDMPGSETQAKAAVKEEIA